MKEKKVIGSQMDFVPLFLSNSTPFYYLLLSMQWETTLEHKKIN
jgi:hypothetical protein